PRQRRPRAGDPRTGRPPPLERAGGADVILALLQWQSPGMLGTAFLVLVAALLAVAILYPGQTRTLPAGWRWALGALRALALAALAISIARPMTTRALQQRERGAIVIIADHSAS